MMVSSHLEQAFFTKYKDSFMQIPRPSVRSNYAGVSRNRHKILDTDAGAPGD
jgi:hypothetical protein